MTTILQITDTHVTAPGTLLCGRIDTHAATARAVAHAAELAPRVGGIDAVVISGDLVDRGTAEEYAAFRELIAPLAPPVCLLPGNHDARGPLRAAFPEAEHLHAGGETLDWAMRVGPLRLVGLDSSVPGEAHGALSAEQIRWLDRTLAAEPLTPTLVFLHHPPFDTGLGFMDAIRLRGEAPLLLALARHPQVRLIGCGHVHRAISTEVAGIPCRISPAPAHALALDHRDLPPAFHLEPGAVTLHRWTEDAAEPLGRLQSQTSLIDPGPGPWPFAGA